MRISLPPPAPDELRRLEAAAAARPGLYRMRLALLALAGDVILTFVRIFPFAAPIVFGALFVNNTYIHALAAFAIMLLIWLMRPGYRDSGRSIEQKDAPELYRILDDLRTKLDVGRRMDVRLEDEVNASAREARGMVWSRRCEYEADAARAVGGGHARPYRAWNFNGKAMTTARSARPSTRAG